MTNREKDILEIKKIRREKDSESLFDKGYGFIRIYSRDDEILKMMCEILQEDWHYSHEDLARSFQSARNPIPIKTLYNVALSDLHTEYEEYYPLQRKCVWAIADIGTEEAKSYLFKIEAEANEIVSSFATKRLQNWEKEIDRKGQRLYNEKIYVLHIGLENYNDSITKLPFKGQFVFGISKTTIRTKEYIFKASKEIRTEYLMVYQACNNAFADFAVENQKLEDYFNDSQMNFITPGFLSMMNYCDWANKENMERILAIWITKNDFEELLQESCLTSFDSELYSTEDEWKNELLLKEGKLHWDSDQDLFGNKLERKVIQLELQGKLLEKFGKEMIKNIIDITDFAKEQKNLLDNNQPDKMLLPRERYIYIEDFKFKRKIGIIY